MTILVTGSAGHLGEALMRALRAARRPAIGFDRRPSPWTDRVGSIGDRALVAALLRGVRAVVHAAALHKPHVATQPMQRFLDVNLSGTLVLLEEAVAAGVEAFVFTSTTSAFGAALTPADGAPAAWITEDIAPVPKNIYGTTKVAAEDLCELFARRHGLPVVVLRTSRFFPEEDDDPVARAGRTTDNLQAVELLHRRVDLADAVAAHLAAVERAGDIGFGLFVVSATTPFGRDDAAALRHDAPAVIARRFPHAAGLFAARGWTLVPGIDRVYVNARAREALGWRPHHDFGTVLRSLAEGSDFRSPLARAVGRKDYRAG